jgi:hypothetical protein
LYFIVTNPASVLTKIILFYSPNTKWTILSITNQLTKRHSIIRMKTHQ